MRFFAAVWMGCSFLAVSRAWAAWWFQKAGSSSSAGQGKREVRSASGECPMCGARWEGPLTWDESEGELYPQAQQQQQQHVGSLHACGMVGRHRSWDCRGARTW